MTGARSAILIFQRMYNSLLWAVALCQQFWVATPATSSLDIDLNNLTPTNGSRVFVAVYDRADAFMQEDKALFKQAYMVGNQSYMRVQIPQKGAGVYAVSCYQDLNGNGKMDTNLVGIPTEPYGFSAGARPKFRAPTWEEAKTWFDGKTALAVRMDKW
jgi:uncharacterized protein (DUF2141 family)